MKILFIHRAFPGQFRYLAAALAGHPDNQVVFLTTATNGQIPGVHNVVYQPLIPEQQLSHHYVRNLENAVYYGQSAYRVARELKQQGFTPDIIVGHSGWGPTLFMPDLFPKVPLVCYYEWFYRSSGSSHGFDPAVSITEDNKAEIRAKNAAILFDLAACSRGISPTGWQQSQFPVEFRKKIAVIHDGVDTDYFSPDKTTRLVLPRLGLDLSAAEEIVTYVATGMEPIRGFPQFMEAVALLQRRRPSCHIVVVGEDRVEYCSPLPNGQTYKTAMLEKYSFDLSRLHFTGRLTLEEYRQVIRSTAAHIYLTYPYILSWSMLEAMSCGAVIVGSATPPVQEVVKTRENGLLADFFSPQDIADKVEEALDDAGLAQKIKANARATILEKYALRTLLPQQAALLTEAMERNHRK